MFALGSNQALRGHVIVTSYQLSLLEKHAMARFEIVIQKLMGQKV